MRYFNFLVKKNCFWHLFWSLFKKAYLPARAFVFYIAIASLLAPNLAQGVVSFESFVDSNLKSQSSEDGSGGTPLDGGDDGSGSGASP